MSNIPLAIAENDVAVVHVPVTSPGDKRILKAEELTLGQRLLVQPDIRVETGWMEPPSLSFVSDFRLRVNGEIRSTIFRRPVSVVGDIDIPRLADTVSVVNRDDYLSVVVFVAEVGIDHDSSIRITDIEEEIDIDGNLTGLTATNFDGENTRRYRLFWGMIYADFSPSVDDFWDALTIVDSVNDSVRELVISDNASVATTGFTIGDMRFYPRDSRLEGGLPYKIVNGMVEIFPLAAIVRRQGCLLNGYTWGKNGEENLSIDFNVKPLFQIAGENLELALDRRMNSIVAGIPGHGFCFTRVVKNLLGGSVSLPSDHPGEPTRSPSGNPIVANGQRISFTNQRILQDYFCHVVWSQYNTLDNRVQLTTSADIDSPVSTQFADPSYHRVFDANGVDQTELGEFTDSGGSGYNTITWVAGPASSFYASTEGGFVSKKAYFVPAIYFAAGSSFAEFFVGVEKVWNNGTEIPSANIRDGENDLAQYVEPSGGSGFIVVHGRERSALHYIYKKVAVTTTAAGVAVIPDNIGGNFAFVQGRSFVEDGVTKYRFNAPVLTGLPPSQSINTLVYYPPKSTGDDWQFQLKVSPYQGIGAIDGASFLQGAKVISCCRFLVHTLGGGGSCFHGDSRVRRSPVSFVLPAVLDGVKHYELDAPVHFAGEGYPGPVNFQEIPPIAGVNLALPHPGMTLSTGAVTAVAHPRSLNVALFEQETGIPLGFGTPTFAKSDDVFQFVLCFVVEKDGQRRLVIATHNGVGGASYALDSSASTAIDLFYL